MVGIHELSEKKIDHQIFVFFLEGERQLIAVSKIDKFDKGIGDKLQGLGPGSMVLKLGCVAVLNRDQQEIDDNISFEEMRQREKEFFSFE